MAALDMAQLVRDHALKLVDRVRDGEQPAVNPDDLPPRDEGVDLRVVYQQHLNILRA